MKILFTCLGNICRSPIAEAVMREKLQQQRLEWEVNSNGTNRYHKGGPADARSITVCKKHGIDLTQHIATRFRTSDFGQYDIIICMASDVFDELQEFVTHSSQLQNVRVKEFNDPWYGGDQGFEDCYQAINKYCDELILSLKSSKTASH